MVKIQGLYLTWS